MVNFSLDEVAAQAGEERWTSKARYRRCHPKDRFSDVYKSEELLRRDEAWSIIIDSSKSLEVKKKEVKDLAICLSEIARDLVQKSSWACYSFDDNFHIIKDFLEPYDRVVKGRIGGLTSGVKTLLPDAMRLAAQRLIRGSRRSESNARGIRRLSAGLRRHREGHDQGDRVGGKLRNTAGRSRDRKLGDKEVLQV